MTDGLVDTDALEQRWLQRFNEFQDFRSQRIARKAAARNELDAAQTEIDAEISDIQNERNQSTEVMKGEADAKIRRIEEQTKVEIQRLQDEAYRKTTEIHEMTRKDLELLQVISEKKTQELEDKRTARKRKHEHDNREIESEFVLRLRSLENNCMPSVCTASRTPGAACEGTVADQIRHCRTRRPLPQLWKCQPILHQSTNPP